MPLSQAAAFFLKGVHAVLGEGIIVNLSVAFIVERVTIVELKVISWVVLLPISSMCTSLLLILFLNLHALSLHSRSRRSFASSSLVIWLGNASLLAGTWLDVHWDLPFSDDVLLLGHSVHFTVGGWQAVLVIVVCNWFGAQTFLETELRKSIFISLRLKDVVWIVLLLVSVDIRQQARAFLHRFVFKGIVTFLIVIHIWK